MSASMDRGARAVPYTACIQIERSFLFALTVPLIGHAVAACQEDGGVFDASLNSEEPSPDIPSNVTVSYNMYLSTVES